MTPEMKNKLKEALPQLSTFALAALIITPLSITLIEKLGILGHRMGWGTPINWIIGG